jgi:hypothetical protein
MYLERHCVNNTLGLNLVLSPVKPATSHWSCSPNYSYEVAPSIMQFAQLYYTFTYERDLRVSHTRSVCNYTLP